MSSGAPRESGVAEPEPRVSTTVLYILALALEVVVVIGLWQLGRYFR